MIWATEQEEIAKIKSPGEPLTWDDLSKMKYTWRVALEILRMIPPVFGSFRKTLKDVEFNGYIIPKGWQVRRPRHFQYIVINCASVTLYIFLA